MTDKRLLSLSKRFARDKTRQGNRRGAGNQSVAVLENSF
jgi:hypothetical protein